MVERERVAHQEVDQYHVVPSDDIKEHILKGKNCWCRPEMNEDGVFIHNSADGREDFETGKRRLS